MKELYELKEKLCKELKEYGNKEMSAGSLEVVDKLSHAIKNIDKIIENYEEEGYSGRNSRRSYGYDYAMASNERGNGRRGGSSRRGSRRGSRNSMNSYDDGYSYHDDMIDELNDLMEDAPDERTKQEIKRFIQKLESM